MAYPDTSSPEFREMQRYIRREAEVMRLYVEKGNSESSWTERKYAEAFSNLWKQGLREDALRYTTEEILGKVIIYSEDSQRRQAS